MLQALDAAAVQRWACATVDALAARREEIDRLNVFPVPDGDTGTNLLATMRAASDALSREFAADSSAAGAAAALAHGALLGARGNSGVIVSQVLRGLAEALAEAALDVSTCSGAALRGALQRADQLATAAVSEPVAGTVLTVLHAAAEAAAGCASDFLPAVAAAAAAAAARALADTPCQLAALARAGVVDAGGLGLVVMLDVLVAVVSGAPPDLARPQVRRPPRPADALRAAREAGSTEFDYEVMYLLDGVCDGQVAVLRGQLAALGDCVAVVGDGSGLWNVHVHCTDVGAAIEAGLAAGRPQRITVVRFADQVARAEQAGRFVRPRAVLMFVAGTGAGDLACGEGAAVVRHDGVRMPSSDEVAAALAGTRASHVVVLPNDRSLTPVAEAAAGAARSGGQQVVVVPTSSVLQGLAALAVHDPARRAEDDVVAMAESAAGTRTGSLIIAQAEALTWVGRCQPGDVLGLLDGDVVLIAADLTAAAIQLVEKMLSGGGELVTAMLGADAPADLGAALAAHLRHDHREVDLTVYAGGQPGTPLLLGVE